MSENPYEPSEFTGWDRDASPVAPMKRPGGVLPIAIVCLLLAILGILGALYMMIVPLVAPAIVAFVERMPEDDMPARQREELINEFSAVGDNAVLLVIMGFVSLVVYVFLISGAISAMRRRSASLLSTACAVTAAFVVAQALISFAMGMMDTSEQLEGIDPAQVQLIQYVVIALTVAWTLAITGFYAFGHFYMKRPAVRAWFEAASRR